MAVHGRLCDDAVARGVAVARTHAGHRGKLRHLRRVAAEVGDHHEAEPHRRRASRCSSAAMYPSCHGSFFARVIASS